MLCSKVDWVRVVGYSLSATHFVWALSLLLEPSRYVGKPVIPWVFALIHIISASFLLFRSLRALGGVSSLLLLTYYWFLVKPVEPIAEPQSVGVIAISFVLFTDRVIGPKVGFLNPVVRVWDLNLLLLRLGLAYPYVEWGLDAFRNPIHFISFMRDNYITRSILPSDALPMATFFLGVFELSLAFLIIVGIGIRWAASASLATLIVFIVVAGYPLALPQDVVLASASAVLIVNGAGEYSIKRLFSSFS